MARVNKSVLAFRALTEDLQKEVHIAAVQELNVQANNLAHTMIRVLSAQLIPPPDTGHLKDSIGVISDKGGNDTIVRVVAGGRFTVKDGYQYPRAMEFGTVKESARPFFFPTYRLLKKKMRNEMKRKIRANIKKRSAA